MYPCNIRKYVDEARWISWLEEHPRELLKGLRDLWVVHTTATRF